MKPLPDTLRVNRHRKARATLTGSTFARGDGGFGGPTEGAPEPHATPTRAPDLSLDPSGAANPWSYEMQQLGYNYRLPDLLCALGLSQLAKLDRFIERRRALSIFVFDLLVGWPGLGLIITLVSACLNPPSLRTRIE